MIKSMTGYGRSELQEDNKNIVVEMKSVNHRYADFSIRYPKYYSFLEEKVREYLQKFISRGKVNVFITIDNYGENNKLIVLDEGLADSYINALNTLKERYDLKDDISVSNVARYTDIFKIEKQQEDQDEVWEIVKKAVDVAVKDFISMREREGGRLKEDLIRRGKDVMKLIQEIETRAPYIVEEYKEKIESRVRELLQNVPLDENRILTEVAIFADKISITEELVRLQSHFVELEDILKSKEPVGRKLDFLIQEMNREINTIGSKANDLFVSKRVVAVKSEIEKMREQVQNIE